MKELTWTHHGWSETPSDAGRRGHITADTPVTRWPPPDVAMCEELDIAPHTPVIATVPAEPRTLEAMKPKRIQRKRTLGWRMPQNCVYVGRPTKFGNHHTVINGNYANAVALYRHWLYSDAGASIREAARRELVGKDLACWCPLGTPCHADVLLELLT